MNLGSMGRWSFQRAGPPRLGLGAWPSRPSTVSASVRGPLLTLAAAIIFDSLVRYGFVVPTPFPALVLTVVYAALSGGLWPAVISALITTLYASHFFSERVGHLRYDVAGLAGLLSVTSAAWVAALVTSRLAKTRLMARQADMTWEEADTIRRRLSLLEQASTLLAASLDYHHTLGRLARLLVPARADWCTIHLMNGHGTFGFVAGAHRDQARDLAVRALGEYGDRGLPFGPPAETADVCRIDEAVLRARTEDEVHLELYHALAPAAALRVPILMRGGVGGVLTLVMADSGRKFAGEDIEMAEELAGRCTLALENAMLHREAGEATRRFESCFTAHPHPMWVFDAETLAFLLVNEAAVREYGYSALEFGSMSVLDLFPRHEPPAAGLERGEVPIGLTLTHLQRHDGTMVDVEMAARELEIDGRQGRLVVARDVSRHARALVELHQSEDQLRQAQRMHAVGRLGLGVFHDFNSVLTTIQGNGDLLGRELAADDPGRIRVERIVRAAERGILLTRRLLAFGDRRLFHPQPVDLHTFVRGMEELIRRLAGDDILVETRLAAAQSVVRIDPARLEQAFVSLILSARDDMPAGGVMKIETAERWVADSATSPPVAAGQYAVIAISDTGRGADARLPGRPLDRRTGEGSGLRVVSGIVRQGGGTVRVSHDPDSGRTVEIYLPLAVGNADLESSSPPHGMETLLVVENDDEIRQMLVRMLRDAGYRVLQAGNGREALKVADRYDGRIDLLVTDVVMPEMSGGDLALSWVQHDQAADILFISGYAEGEVRNRGIERAEGRFLCKPFTTEELLRTVRTLLDRDRA